MDDFGTIINPMIVEGQVHGGIAQGIGQALLETKSPSNPLGIKGCGEAGAIAAPAAVINAITDAIGTEELAMPATAQAVWAALKSAQPRQAA